MGKVKRTVPSGWKSKEWKEFNAKWKRDMARQCEEFILQMNKRPEEFKYKYDGVLELYYETGMEGMYAVILHDDRGNHEGPKWDNPNETMTYRSLEWSHWFSLRDVAYLTVRDPDGKEIFSGHVTNSKKKMAAADNRISFAPEQIDLADWMVWVSKEYRATVWTDSPCLAEDEKHQAGQKVLKEKWAKERAEREQKEKEAKENPGPSGE